MNRPEKEISYAEFQRNPQVARRLLAYLLRSTKMRIDIKNVGRERYKRLATEISDALVPLVVSERTSLGFYRAFCVRFGVDPSGGDNVWGAIEAWLPEGRVRWDHVIASLDYSDLRLVIQESSDFVSTFACSKQTEGEDQLFQQFPAPTVSESYRPKLPKMTIQPSSHRSIWTLTSPLHHGADEKHGNTNLFRRHRTHDPLTGQTSYVPFISGNAIRGLWRDIVMERWLNLLGLSPRDLPSVRAHALLAGGSVEAGADMAKVNNKARDRARDLCPAWDLLAGCIDQQIMGGRINVGDAILICKENAWLVHGEVAPEIPLDVFAKALPHASEMTQLRLGTRQSHKDIPEDNDIQMLWNTEVLVPGHQMLHSFQVRSFSGAKETTLSCLADLLNLFKLQAMVGAGTARGYGSISFDSYSPGTVDRLLPSPDIYLSEVERRKSEMIEWATTARGPTVEVGKVNAQKSRKITAGPNGVA